MTSSKPLIYCLFSLLLLSVHTHTSDQGDGYPGCAHGLIEDTNFPLDVDETFIIDDGRNLASTYPNFRIYADYTRLTEGSTDFINYVTYSLVPAVIDYFQAALDIRQPLTSNLKLTSTSICDYSTPTSLKNGVATDFFLLVTATNDTTSNWVASAGSCYVSSTTARPLIGRMMFNLAYTVATTDVLVHERNCYVTMHEFMHALGFTASAFKTFIDPTTGKTLTGHIKTVTINGASTWTALDVEPLTSKLRTFFGCSSYPGAFMEDEGGAGTAGSHFERRQFLYEFMTSGVIPGLRISEFSLALLEGSGWYMPNYTYAEPFYFGQGEGCNFLYLNCSSSSFNYDEFCYTSSARQCSAAGRGGGVCSTDTRSDGCMYSIPVTQYDCQNPDASSYARLPNQEVFGRTAGSECFDGTLTTKTSAASTSFCFTYKCVGSGTSTSLQVNIGSTTVTCTQEGQLTVKGYNGYLSCPDPLTFCNTVGLAYCPRGCLGRGQCVNNQCVCNAGYSGVDCAFSS